MPSYQKLALNCNFRWRYKRSKFDSIPYKSFKICSGSFNSVWNQLKIREIYMGQYQTFILYITAGNRPFYSSLLGDLAFDDSEAKGDLALIQTSLLLSCKST